VKENLWSEVWKALGETGWNKNDGLHVKLDVDAEWATMREANPNPARCAVFDNMQLAANELAHPEANTVVHEATVVDSMADI
jgi:hypothetical protein